MYIQGYAFGIDYVLEEMQKREDNKKPIRFIQDMVDKERCTSMCPHPQFDLPRHWFGLRERPVGTTLAEWRKAFVAECTITTDPLARNNFERILKLLTIAEECGATHINFRMRSENRTKWLEMENVFFPENILYESMATFSRRLSEID